LAGKVREFTSFVAEQYKAQGRTLPQNERGSRITYHDSCHMRRGLGVWEQPRELIKMTGADFVEMKDSDRCCGMAGAFGVKYSEISKPILHDKLENIANTGADTVAVACPACMMQIGGGLNQQNPRVKVKHVADILAECIAER
jgi:Fe-S oxidoreductase